MEQEIEIGQLRKKKRMANIELLRILAMIMVVMLHFLSKGNLLPDITKPISGNGYIAWILETLSIVAVNVYMIISGFFLVESGFKIRRLFQLLCQVLFYSLLIPIILIAAGILPLKEITIYKLLQYCLPVQMEHYWFVTAYVVMYLFSPLLTAAVKYMSQKQLKAVIILLLLFYSINKSILPVHLTIDKQGYDGVWFLCVYLVAAYMRLYGISFFQGKGKSWLVYFGSCIGILGITLSLHFFYLKTGKLEDFLLAGYHYNHILNLLAAVSLFYAFYYSSLKEGWGSNIICKVASCTFGVYLLHEQLEIRYLWQNWIGVNSSGNGIEFVLRAIGSVLVVFAIGILVDMVRKQIFRFIGGFLQGGKLEKVFERMDTIFR